MKVICAGLSKTGTKKTLAKALRILGYTVYDYSEHRDFHIDEWLDIYCEGKAPDFTAMYKDVDAVTDFLAATWFREIYEAFPDEKVILSVRDNEDVWVHSLSKQLVIIDTLRGFVNRIALLLLAPVLGMMFAPITTVREVKGMLKARGFLLTRLMAAFGTASNWKSMVLFKKKYREHDKRVQAVIPKEKLLIYNVKQGWKPLCEFFHCDVPKGEFPRENTSLSPSQREMSTLIEPVKRHMYIFLAIICVLLAAVFYLVFQ